MKLQNLLFIATVLFVINSHAQIKVTEVTVNDKVHYQTTVIGYPITGTYLFEGKTEPIIQLNQDGTGIFQTHEMQKNRMIWGIECTEKGIPIFREGFSSAVYTLWYKTNEKKINLESESWTEVQFSIHFNKKKMYISGERSKDYVE